MQISLDQLRVLLRIGLGELGFNREASARSARTLSVRPRAGAIVRARAAPSFSLRRGLKSRRSEGDEIAILQMIPNRLWENLEERAKWTSTAR